MIITHLVIRVFTQWLTQDADLVGVWVADTYVEIYRLNC